MCTHACRNVQRRVHRFVLGHAHRKYDSPVRVDMGTDIRIDICADICVDICAELMVICGDRSNGRLQPLPVCIGSVIDNLYGQAYRHAHGHAYRDAINERMCM